MPTASEGRRYEVIGHSLLADESAELVHGVSGQRIQVVKAFVLSSAETYLTLRSSGGTVLAGPIPVGELGGWLWPADGWPWVECPAGESLMVHTTVAAQLGGICWYTYSAY